MMSAFDLDLRAPVEFSSERAAGGSRAAARDNLTVDILFAYNKAIGMERPDMAGRERCG
jgi:hypothetical protein